MLTGIRSAIICDEIRQRADGSVDLIGLHQDVLQAASKPGFLAVSVSLMIELDRKATAGQVKVFADQFAATFPFDIPPGWGLVSIGFPLNVPVFKPGPLTVAVSDAARPGKPFRFKWSLSFTPDAKELDEAAAQEVADACQQSADLLVNRTH